MAKKVVIGHSKRVRFNNDRLVVQALPPSDAVKALRQYKAPKFDQTVNVVVHLGRVLLQRRQGRCGQGCRRRRSGRR
jgi:ribosomal protein L1